MRRLVAAERHLAAAAATLGVREGAAEPVRARSEHSTLHAPPGVPIRHAQHRVATTATPARGLGGERQQVCPQLDGRFTRARVALVGVAPVQPPHARARSECVLVPWDNEPTLLARHTNRLQTGVRPTLRHARGSYDGRRWARRRRAARAVRRRMGSPHHGAFPRGSRRPAGAGAPAAPRARQ
ncbi:hypothetical protein T492DRAFT_189773 [Pavlovales sp. CCMP2436]|nr:hypothetical protein T492DRAFT_189773 [Pavlovales sp. CCMP2436]